MNLLKKRILLCTTCILLLEGITNYSIAKNRDQDFSREGIATSDAKPRALVDAVVSEANAIQKTQETALNGVTSTQGNPYGDNRGKILSTLNRVRDHLHPYLQILLYAGLTISVIALIYNGSKMVTNTINGGAGDPAKVKQNLLYIAFGIIILTGVYWFLDIIIAIINFIFN